MLQGKPTWWVYMLECADGTLYTGCSNDVTKRVADHNAGQGAKYTRPRLPVKLVYQEKLIDRSSAQQREAQLKKLTRLEKLELIKDKSLWVLSSKVFFHSKF